MSACPRISLIILAIAIAGVGTLGSAQNAPRAVFPFPNPEEVKHAPPRAAGYLARKYGLSPAEASAREARAQAASRTATDLANAFPGHLLATVIDHTPNFRITYVFDRDVTAAELQSRIPADLRSFVRTKRSRYTGPEILERQRKITAAIASQALTGAVAYDFRTDKFDVTIGADEAPGSLMNRIPVDLRSDVRVKKGAPASIQTGVQAGDSLYGGWIVSDATNLDVCTWGFPVRLTTSQLQAILTAGHCPDSTKVRYEQGGVVTHYVTMPPPSENEYRNTDRSYDFKIIETRGLTSGPWAWYWNSRSGTYSQYMGPGVPAQTKQWANVNPDLDVNGQYLRVTDVVHQGSAGPYNPTHPVGDVRCKMGFKTGITCGQITSSQTAVVVGTGTGSHTYLDLVKFDTPDYMVLALGGDSGGPVTTNYSWNATSGTFDVFAAGVMVAVDMEPNGTLPNRPCINPDDAPCDGYYMAIDRINDFQGVAVITSSGDRGP